MTAQIQAAIAKFEREGYPLMVVRAVEAGDELDKVIKNYLSAQRRAISPVTQR